MRRHSRFYVQIQWQFLCYNFIVISRSPQILVLLSHQHIYTRLEQNEENFPYFLILKRFLLAVKEIFSVVFCFFFHSSCFPPSRSTFFFAFLQLLMLLLLFLLRNSDLCSVCVCDTLDCLAWGGWQLFENVPLVLGKFSRTTAEKKSSLKQQ